ncbi:hypothetical protein Daus18300_008360 [Diaporthe australafricana]|uniref:RanBP2-type domain-containing protein n=1 Tax=Diaporthe australafricana TaxID=127596 RepID=A0ABR3WIK5_9PEZI
MANNNSTNQDAELSKYFIESDEVRGLNAFEVAALDIPRTARPGGVSPLAWTFELEQEGKGLSPRKSIPAHRSEAQIEPAKVPRNGWKCCQCSAINPFLGPACWQCETHVACEQCSPA